VQSEKYQEAGDGVPGIPYPVNPLNRYDISWEMRKITPYGVTTNEGCFLWRAWDRRRMIPDGWKAAMPLSVLAAAWMPAGGFPLCSVGE
jgi:hypothetical protein